jgi:hypothetical protein
MLATVLSNGINYIIKMVASVGSSVLTFIKVHWYNVLLWGLLVIPIAFSLLGIGTQRRWSRYTFITSCSFLGWAGESWRLQHSKNEITSAFSLVVCALIGGVVAGKIANRKHRL